MEGVALDNIVLLSVALVAAALLLGYVSRKLRSNQVRAFLVQLPVYSVQPATSADTAVIGSYLLCL